MNQQRRFTTQINIAAPPERVLQFLGDLINLKHLHPLIQNVQRVDAPEGCVRAYKITDLIDFGLFSRQVDYTAEVLEETPRRLVTHATPGFGVDLVSEYTVEDTPMGCELRQQTDISCSCFLIGKVYNELSSSHTSMHEKMKSALQNELASKVE